MRVAMAEDRAAEAIARIERALARIEAAAAAPRAAPDQDAEVQRLRQAHAALRGKVEGAIAQIDRLLEHEEA
jgi:hypothetical protein